MGTSRQPAGTRKNTARSKQRNDVLLFRDGYIRDGSIRDELLSLLPAARKTPLLLLLFFLSAVLCKNQTAILRQRLPLPKGDFSPVLKYTEIYLKIFHIF